MKNIDLEGIKSKATSYHNSGKYSCAESVFLTLAETFEIDDSVYGVASGFAGGAMCGYLCGASSGAIIAVGLIFGRENFGKDKMANKARILSKEISSEFINQQKNSECRIILKDFEMGTLAQHDKCINITGNTAKLAANIIARELGYNII